MSVKHNSANFNIVVSETTEKRVTFTVRQVGRNITFIGA